jgi:hypothetical protein
MSLEKIQEIELPLMGRASIVFDKTSLKINLNPENKNEENKI